MKNSILVLFAFFLSFTGFAQQKKMKLKASIAFASASALLYNDFAKNKQSEFHAKQFPNFSTRADDFLQYSPALLSIGVRLAGLHTSSKPKEQLVRFVLGSAIYAGSTKALKILVNETRPDGTAQSFPSGHTATAFFGARMLAKEFGEEYPALAITGYVLAGSTAAIRIANNEHWATDVLMGAAIGIGSAEVAYWVYPKLKEAFGPASALRFEPVISPNYYAANLRYVF